MNITNGRFKKKLNEVYFITPNNLGVNPLTNLYKKIVDPIKIMPFIFIIPISFLIGLALYLIFGLHTIKFTSLLQYGF